MNVTPPDEDILEKLDRAWTEDFKMNLMHYCDLAAQEIRKLRAENVARTARQHKPVSTVTASE